MKLTNDWFSAIAENNEGETIFIAGRDHLQEFRESGKFKQRVEITWPYAPDAKGMPTDQEAELMEQVQVALQKEVEKNKLAILTSLYTGAGERIFVFYTRTSVAFGQSLNQALSTFDILPITLYVEQDEQWSEYMEMIENKPVEQ